jgi:hypothetical protein
MHNLASAEKGNPPSEKVLGRRIFVVKLFRPNWGKKLNSGGIIFEIISPELVFFVYLRRNNFLGYER